jgi:hypothetical protein
MKVIYFIITAQEEYYKGPFSSDEYHSIFGSASNSKFNFL